jgi:hypothetical protein
MAHFSTLMSFNRRLGQLTLTDATLAITMINNLPSRDMWESVRQGALNTAKDPKDLRFQTVREHHAVRLKSPRGIAPNPSSTVLAAVTTHRPPSSSNTRFCPRKPPKVDKVFCDYCEQMHLADECWKMSRDQLHENMPNVTVLAQETVMTSIASIPTLPATHDIFCGIITQSLATTLARASSISSTFKEAPYRLRMQRSC